MAVALVLVCAVALSSCALVPVFQTDNARADAQMERVAAALEDGDREALTSLFSTTAVQEATDLDNGLDYLLSLFSEGNITWKRNTSVGGESENDHEIRTRLLRAFYKVTVDGKDYRLLFADFTVNSWSTPTMSASTRWDSFRGRMTCIPMSQSPSSFGRTPSTSGRTAPRAIPAFTCRLRSRAATSLKAGLWGRA